MQVNTKMDLDMEMQYSGILMEIDKLEYIKKMVGKNQQLCIMLMEILKPVNIRMEF